MSGLSLIHILFSEKQKYKINGNVRYSEPFFLSLRQNSEISGAEDKYICFIFIVPERITIKKYTNERIETSSSHVCNPRDYGLQRRHKMCIRDRIYTEAFCGGAAVLFAKRPSEAEIINDINMELTNFYWCMQVYYSDLKHEINKTLHSRDLHAHAGHINSYPQFFTPVERAWAVWVLCKMSFASMMDGTFGYDFSGTMTKKLRNAKDEFTERLCQRLERVTIENRNALDVIDCYDAPDTFHLSLIHI